MTLSTGERTKIEKGRRERRGREKESSAWQRMVLSDGETERKGGSEN
jgi:hypothetical protein